MQQRVLFISNQLSPLANSGGGSIVIYRHLKRFKDEGYLVTYIHSSLYKIQHEFEEMHIKKKKWFPPLRSKTPFLTRVRIWIYFRLIKKKLNIKPGDVILSVLGEYSNLLALKIAKKYNLPLYMIYHDDSLFNVYGKLNLLSTTHVKDLFKNVTHFFAVSAPMKALLEAQGAKSCSVLYPIPEGYDGPVKQWRNVNSQTPAIYNSGLLFEDLHLELLQTLSLCAKKIQASINLIGRLHPSFEEKLLVNTGINIIERFKSTTELFEHLVTNSDALLVFYSFKLNHEHRMYHSFPSKFTEYCHLGLPILIVAPVESSIGKWATDNNWISYLQTDDPESILNLMSKLKQQEFWMLCQAQSLKTAKQFFDPYSIHQQLSQTLFPGET